MSSQVESMIGRYSGKTVLALGAHPDDLEIGAGGTLARLADAGARVVMAVVCVPSDLEPRRKEAESSARILGGEPRLLFGDRAQRVEDIKTYELVRRLDDLVRELQPAAVVSHSDVNYHRDHVLVHQATVSAQRLAFFDLYCYYPISCHPVAVAFHPQAYIDISKTIDRKMKAIDTHSTMFTCRGIATDHYRDVARSHGRVAGVEFAEGLEVHRLLLG